jgi:hypothetical protein
MCAFPQQQDPEDIVGTLLVLRNTGRLPTAEPLPAAHELLLVIDGAQWTASTSSFGRFSYATADLAPEDLAPFALLDALTRWLPRWRGGAVLVRTNDVCVMWGIRGYARSGVWRAVRRSVRSTTSRLAARSLSAVVCSTTCTPVITAATRQTRSAPCAIPMPFRLP